MARRGRTKPRVATPRLAEIRAWRVERRPRFRRRKANPPQDVVLLLVDVEWEHGQPQELRLPIPLTEIPSIIAALATAWATDVAVIHGGAPARRTETVADVDSPQTTTTSTALETPERRAKVLAGLEARMDQVFADRDGARRSFVDAAMRTNDVGSFEDLSLSALAAMHNQLGRVLHAVHPS